ncbi:MAG: putative tail fiber-like protein [Prokaryotic dsDNA virus sp.]|nr:MAG: putative tail fiber-like protein [Prokaryotic dsDNA virus sp.]|tara:strand:- start:26042 stop:27574 length:1533 start_codon:yes stop_codon:yes gene_type:complete
MGVPPASVTYGRLKALIAAVGVTVQSSAPLTPETGDLWYDTTRGELKVYDGDSWEPSCVPVHVGVAAPASPEAGDLWWDETYLLLKVYDGADWHTTSDHVLIEVRNDSGGAVTKGQPLFVHGTHASGKPNVRLADNDDGMPAVGLAHFDIADGAEGFAIISGVLEHVNTSSYSAGEALYVDSTAGQLTNVRPTGTANKVQKVALVTRSHAVAGSILIIGAGRTNDIPNEIETDFNIASGATPTWSGTPTGSSDLTTKTYVDTQDGSTQTALINYFSFGIPASPLALNTSGNITVGGTVDGRDVASDGTNQDTLQTLTGVTAGSADLGTFTGSTIADSETLKGALQDLEDAVEANKASTMLAIGTSTGSIANTTLYLPWDTAASTATADSRGHIQVDDEDSGTETSDSTIINIYADGRYQIDCSVRVSGNNRVESFCRLELDTGSGFSRQSTHVATNYALRDADQNTGSVTLSTLLTLNNGDRLRFQAEGDADNAANLVLNGTLLRIIRHP